MVGQSLLVFRAPLMMLALQTGDSSGKRSVVGEQELLTKGLLCCSNSGMVMVEVQCEDEFVEEELKKSRKKSMLTELLLLL